MPQTFQVLRCYQCEVFQVHPTKKANKWKCKLCNEKQSMKRFYGLGSGKECRLHVQKLNGIRGDIDATHCESDVSDPVNETGNPVQSGRNEILSHSIAMKSKWLDYIDPEENEFTVKKQQISDEPIFLSNTEVILQLSKKCKRTSVTVSTEMVNRDTTDKLLKQHSQTSIFSKQYKKAKIMPLNEKQLNDDSSLIGVSNDVSTTQVVSDSKWAKFVEDTQKCKDENNFDPISHTDRVTSAHNPMFTLQGEEELDLILDL